MAVTGGSAHAAPGQSFLVDGFHDATTTSPVIPVTFSNNVSPCLTAGTDPNSSPIAGCNLSPPDPVGSGVLRFTDTAPAGNEVSGIAYQPAIPLAQGLSVEFKTYMWGGTGADGIAFALVAGDVPFRPGGYGGSLGYSDHLCPTTPTDYSTLCGTATVSGLPGGWLGFGLDSHGNFPRLDADGADSTADPVANCPDRASRVNTVPNNVTVRGPGDFFTGYCLLGTTAFGSTQLTLPSLSAATRAASQRGVKIVIDPTAGTWTVGLDATGGTNYTTVLSGPLPTFYYTPNDSNPFAVGTRHDGMPAQVYLAFTGSTGDQNDNNEISDVVAGALPSGSASPPQQSPPQQQPPPADQHHDHAGSNDPNPNTNPAFGATTATMRHPTVSALCTRSRSTVRTCTLSAITRDEHMVIGATDAGTGGGDGPSVLSLTINGGGPKPKCAGYQVRDRDWVRFGFTSGGNTFRKTGTMTSNSATNRAQAERLLAQKQVCFAAPYRFAPRPGFGLRRAGSWFDGVLPDCTSARFRRPCVAHRSILRVDGGWVVRLQFRVPPNRKDPKALG
jgi:hypothetical protein